MYKLISAKRDLPMDDYDYIFTGFDTFYSIACVLTYPLTGQYLICVKSDSAAEIKEFIEQEKLYASLIVHIITQESVIDYLTSRDQTVVTQESESLFTIFKEAIQKRELLFDNKNTISVLFASIEHSVTAINKSLDLLVEEFGPQVLITKDSLAKYFILNEVVYPRQVLLAYLRMERWRGSKLRKCLAVFGNDITLGAITKNIKQLVKDKVAYYKTGATNYMLQYVDTKNILSMYRLFVVERGRFRDVQILLGLYERGVAINDLLYTSIEDLE